MSTVGIIGIGRLGSAIALRLLDAEFDVMGCDIDPAPCRWLEESGGRAATAFEIALSCRRILLCLRSHASVRDLLSAVRPGTILIDTTAASPAESESACEAFRKRGVAYLDAPCCDWHETVRARGGKFVCGGDPSAVSACRDIFTVFANPLIHAGPPGAGSRMKLSLDQP